jgi:hypothetical protein
MQVEDFVPLSFKNNGATTLATLGIVMTAQTDIQELNSIAANQHYNRNSTYYDLHTNNRQCILVEGGNCSYLADRNDANFAELCKTHKWDANGATILHQCFQHRKYELVKWFVTMYPKFSLEPYLLKKIVNDKEITLPYGGQNILHMAVLAKNYVVAKWILDFYSRLSDKMLHDLLTERVYTQSGYFDKKGDHYYGETPLQFAVCMDDVEMVNLIMSFASLLEPFNIRLGKSTRNLLFYPDCNGNNVVHMCVKGSLHKMYEHLKYFAVEMLQQELMVSVHRSMLVANADEADITVNYNEYFEEVAAFPFRGYVRKMGNIRLPSKEVRKKFFLAQVYKHLESSKKVGKDDVIKFLATLPKRVPIKAEDVIAIASPNKYDQLISELKHKLGRWLYGIEIGVKSGEINRMFNQFFLHGLNEEGHSPVTLAASLGQALMLRHFIKENVSHKDRGYEFDLTGIEFKLETYTGASTDRPVSLYHPPVGQLQLQSSIAWICHNREANIYSMADSIPEIATVVNYKWERVGSVLFENTLELEASFLILMMVLSITIEWYSHSSGREATFLLMVWIWLLVAGGFMFSRLITKHRDIWFENFVTAARSQLTKRRPSFRSKILAKLTDAIYSTHVIFLDGAQLIRNIRAVNKQTLMEAFFSLSDLACEGCRNTDFTKVLNLIKSIRELRHFHIARYPGEWDIGLKMCLSVTMAGAVIFGALAAGTAVLGNSALSLIPLRLTCFFVKITTLLGLSGATLHLLLQNENFGRFLLTILHILTKDIQSFGYFFCLVVIFAALALNTISSVNPFAGTDHSDNMGLVQLFLKLIQEAASDESNSDETLVRVLTTLFHVTINIIMMNLLIAVMSTTYATYNVEQSSAAGKH